MIREDDLIWLAHITRSAEFADFEEDLAKTLHKHIYEVYLTRDEPNIVRVIQEVVNGVDGISSGDGSLSMSAGFMHWPNSGIRVGHRLQKQELADMLFVSGFKRRGVPLILKMTLSQFKKANKEEAGKIISWPIDLEQLDLLSCFPDFRGTRKYIPHHRIDLRQQNESGNLGSFCLLSRSNGFTFLGGRQLAAHIGTKKSINGNDIYRSIRGCNFGCKPLIGDSDIDRIRSLLTDLHFDKFICSNGEWWPYLELVGNFDYAVDTSDFVSKYIRLSIGERVVCGTKTNIKLHRLLKGICSLVHDDPDSDEQLRRFAEKLGQLIYSENLWSEQEDVEKGEEDRITFDGRYPKRGMGMVLFLLDLDSGI